MKKITIAAFSTLALILVGAAGYWGFQSSSPVTPTAPPAPKTVEVTRCDVEQTVSAPGRLINTLETSIKMPVEGKLEKVLVKPGQLVKAGQVLAKLDDVARSEARLKMIEAKDELETAQKVRTSMDYPRATDEYIHQLEEELEVAKENVAITADMYRNASGAEMKAQALTDFSNAQQKLDDLNARFNWYRGKPSQSDIDTADTKLELAQAKYEAAKAVLDTLEIKAPFDGAILDVKAAIGQTFSADDDLFKMTDPKSLQVEANITEEDYPLLKTGMDAELFFDARPDITINGRVERILPKRIEGNRPLYNIYICLDEIPDGLADGMTSDASVTIARRADVLCLPRAVVRASGEGKANLKVWDGVQTQNRSVTVGLRGDAFVEILSGLKEHEKVVTQ